MRREKYHYLVMPEQYLICNIISFYLLIVSWVEVGSNWRVYIFTYNKIHLLPAVIQANLKLLSLMLHHHKLNLKVTHFFMLILLQCVIQTLSYDCFSAYKK